MIKTFANADVSSIKSIRLLGEQRKLKWQATEQGLVIPLPKKKPEYGMAYPIRIEFDGEIVPPGEGSD